ncbi:ribosomal protein S5, C-terminal domain-containing protein [Zopfochytrium polystomum]|nr:ribosomal protein S5, C-terminal domain-containing protein [Zopfochytrium polystomum]
MNRSTHLLHHDAFAAAWCRLSTTAPAFKTACGVSLPCGLQRRAYAAPPASEDGPREGAKFVKDPLSGLEKRVLHVRQVSRTTSGGKIRTTSALVIVGNRDGLGGYGEGRAKDAAAAILKATRVAAKNMIPIQRFEHRTIFGDINLKHHGYGVVANNNVHEVCRCVGITDLSSNIRGSVNPINVVKATFEALQQQRNPADIAMARGKKLVDVAATYYGLK